MENSSKTTDPADHPAGAATPGKTGARDDQWTLLLQSVAGRRDKQAFGQLFTHFAPLLKAFVLSTPGLASNAVAEELVQEVMIRVWNRAETFNAEKASATTWIYTLARNMRIDFLRKQNREAITIDSDELWEIAAEQDEVDGLAEQGREQEEVQQALATLPVEQRQIVAKIYVEGKSHSEVAAELGLPLGTVKSRIRLALSKLKVVLGR